VLTQSLARHLKIPGIVLLLGAGVLLGPDVAGIIFPETLGSVLHVLVGLAVAVILFEGGMSLNISRLRRQSRPIQMLVTAGVIITTAGGAVTSRLILGWNWQMSILFGTLIVVTGPTVIQPLLRRIKVKSNVSTVLEAEAVFIDAVGATLAVVALGIVINPAGTPLSAGLLLFLQKMGAGVLLGMLGGIVIAGLLKMPRVVPEGLENIFALSLVLALYQISHSLYAESGIVAVTMAGLTVGNVETKALPDVKEFKEQLTVMFVGLLFVLLAADVRIEEVARLGWGGIATVFVLMFAVRPLNVAISTARSKMTVKEKLFLSWLAPRGIVAAAVASLFAQELTVEGIPGGRELRALVFLVIAVTVIVQGLGGGVVARFLGIRRKENNGFVILGANDLGLALGRSLGSTGEEVVFIDSSPHASHKAEEAGFRTIFGNVFEESPLLLAEADSRAACIGITPNEEVNLLFASKAINDHGVGTVHVALRVEETGITTDMVRKRGASLLFGSATDIEHWAHRFGRSSVSVEVWEWNPGEDPEQSGEKMAASLAAEGAGILLPMTYLRSERISAVDDRWKPRPGDRIHFAIMEEAGETAISLLSRFGWIPI
jgi:NhaP-type Na+/H+ or K+/H+ antiporter